MSDPTDEDKVREGTEALQQIADEVEAEREEAGKKVDVPDDELEQQVTAEEDETREDHLDGEDADPLEGENKEVRMGNYAKLNQRGGGPQV